MKVESREDDNKRFLRILNQCLENPNIDFLQSGKRLTKKKEVFCYELVLKTGPFQEHRVRLFKEYFRPLDDGELVKLIFKTLCMDGNGPFVFSFAKCKFVKMMEIMG